MPGDAGGLFDVQHPQHRHALPLRDRLRANAELLCQCFGCADLGDSARQSFVAVPHSRIVSDAYSRNQVLLCGKNQAVLYASEMALKDRIAQARIAKGFTQASLAERIGVTGQAVAQWESGTTEPRDLTRIIKLADELDLSLDYLVRGDGVQAETSAFRPRDHAPLLTRVAAGRWNDVISPSELPSDTQFFELSLKPRGYAIALELDGESMLPDFRPSDIIIIDTGLSPMPGDNVVAILEATDEATFKRYRLRGADRAGLPIVDLVPLNPDYPTLTIDADHPGRIIGTMIEHRRLRQRSQSVA